MKFRLRHEMNRIGRTLKSINLWAVVLALILAGGLALDWRWLRGNDEFRWGYYALPGMEERAWLTILAAVLIGLLCYLLIEWASKRPYRFHAWAVVALLFAAALGIQWAMLRLEHPDPLATLFYRTISTRNLGAFYFDATTTTDIAERLRRFPELMPDFHSFSPRTHPPGLQVMFWSAVQLLQKMPAAAAWLGLALRVYLCNDPQASPVFFYPDAVLGASVLQLLMPLWGALTIFPFYGLARMWFDPRTAVRGAVLLILGPSMVLFAAHWAHFYTLLALVALFLLYYGLRGRRWWPLLAAGLLASAASFLSFSNLAVAALIGITALVFWVVDFLSTGRGWRAYSKSHLRLIAAQSGAFLVGITAVWLLYYAGFGVTFFDVYRQGLRSHTSITGYRSYGLWLGYNLFDFLLFLGIPAVIALAIMIVRQFRPRTGKLRFAPQTIPFWSFFLTIVALDLSGVSKGEVARLWMFLVPVAVLAILPEIGRWRRGQVGVAIGVLVFQLLFMGYYIRTIGSTNYPYYVPRVVETAVPAAAEQIRADFSGGEQISLLGYDLDAGAVQAGQDVGLTLYWQAERPLHHSYTMFVHLVDPQTGELIAQSDSLPQQGELPTLCWQTAEVVQDRHTLQLDPALAPGDYLLRTGIYRLDLLQAGDADHRLVLEDGGDTLLDIATIRIVD